MNSIYAKTCVAMTLMLTFVVLKLKFSTWSSKPHQNRSCPVSLLRHNLYRERIYKEEGRAGGRGRAIILVLRFVGFRKFCI